jgi:hypothetical protein
MKIYVVYGIFSEPSYDYDGYDVWDTKLAVFTDLDAAKQQVASFKANKERFENDSEFHYAELTQLCIEEWDTDVSDSPWHPLLVYEVYI